jgi:hypothetical protein
MSALLQTAVLSSAFLAALRIARSRPAWGNALGVLAFLATLGDLGVAQKDLLLYAPIGAWRTQSTAAAHVFEQPAGSRIYRQLGPAPPAWEHSSSSDRFTELVRWDRETLRAKYPLPERISLLDAPQTIDSADYRAFLAVAHRGERVDPSILDLLGAQAAIVSRGAAPQFSQAENLAEGAVLGVRQNPLPRAWIVHRVDVLPEMREKSPQRLRQRTEDVLFPDGRPRDWRTVAVIETDEPIAPGPPAEDLLRQESCRIVYADPARVEIEAELAADGVVVLADLFYPGWELTVETKGNLRTLPIQRANRLLRGALLPPGKHRLCYRYRPRSVLYGAATSGLAAALLGLTVCTGLCRRVRELPPG